MNFIDRRLLTSINWGLLLSLILLYAVGIVNLYSACGTRTEDGILLSSFYRKQLIWGVGGLFVMLGTMSFDYRRLAGISHILYGISLGLLMLVPLVGKVVLGARRWLDFGFFQFQPSEAAKIAVLLFGAEFLSKYGNPLDGKALCTVMVIAIIPAVFVSTQPDLGTALTILFILGGMALYHGITAKVILGVGILVPLTIPIMWNYLLHDYQKQRILTLFNSENDILGAGYHIIQAKIAIGSGELFGKGWLQGTQSQLRFLPEKHTDFALAVFGEEWGFVGCVALMGLFCVFLLGIFTTVRDAKDQFGSTLAAGVFVYFFWQITINTGMVLGLLPVVGIPLPFLSYGGSAMLLNFALVGLVLNISMRRFMFKS